MTNENQEPVEAIENETEVPPKDVVEEIEAMLDEYAEEDLRELDDQMSRLQGELDQTKEQLLRTMADFQNYKRRNQEQVSQLRQFATENLVTALLPVLDNFERTVTHASQGASIEQVVAGVQAVEKQLKSVLEGQNVRRIAAVGQPFDPEIHEAISSEASEDHAPNTVILEIEAGYRMGDKVIRPSRVKVSSAT